MLKLPTLNKPTPYSFPKLLELVKPEYNKPIIFFEEDSNIVVFYPNGNIIHRGRKVTNDYEIVRALQEILSLSPCRQNK
jgi:hypothetical protein